MEIARPKDIEIKGTVYTGTWSSEKIPVYTVLSADGLNQFVGYVKHINATNGTVLYRGQCNLHPSVIPSICRDTNKLAENKANLDSVLEIMVQDEGVKKYWHLGENRDISDWKEYQKLILEATLQHYGASTFCVDFVDNHWTALWFGLYRWDKDQGKYEKRDPADKGTDEDKHIVADTNARVFVQRPAPPESIGPEGLTSDEYIFAKEQAARSKKPEEYYLQRALKKLNAGKMSKWREACRRYDNDRVRKLYFEHEEEGHLFLFLYVADTNAPTVRGISLGRDTYVLDLRKTIPSTFLRPCAQHGWIVKGIQEEQYCYEKNIACVLRIGVGLVSELLGNGILTSEKNFFPTYHDDNGYDILLRRQMGTNRAARKKFPKILPENTIPVFE